MSPKASSESSGEIRETEAAFVLERAFAGIVRKADFYLTTDLDRISRKTIEQDLRYLERIDGYFAQAKRKLPAGVRSDFTKRARRIKGLVDQIIPDFYVARGHATPGTPRDREYYSRMQAARRSWRDIKRIAKFR